MKGNNHQCSGREIGIYFTVILRRSRRIYSLFNPQDLAFLESAPGRQAIIDFHVRAIIRYMSL